MLIGRHLVLVSQGGANDLENLVGTCLRCNQLRGGTEGRATTFCALEDVPMDDAHEDLAQAIMDEDGEDATSCLAVAAVLREQLRDHAGKLGCDCRSAGWLGK